MPAIMGGSLNQSFRLDEELASRLKNRMKGGWVLRGESAPAQFRAIPSNVLLLGAHQVLQSSMAATIWIPLVPEHAGSDEERMRDIRELLGKEPGLDQLDLAEKLGLRLEESVRLCDELRRRGKIRVVRE